MHDIYEFLRRNRRYNHHVQQGTYNEWLSPWSNSANKTISLLHHVANTQSQPKLDYLFQFWEQFHYNNRPVNSFHDLLIKLGGDHSTAPTYTNLYTLLEAKPGWGEKTAALFTKMVYHTHAGSFTQFSFLQGAPNRLTNGDHLYLPVDNVIKNIFKYLDVGITISFDGINNFLADHFGWKSIEVWDDLWFWGFITQKQGSEEFGFNEPKYWALLHTSKNNQLIARIRLLSQEFNDLLSSLQ